MHVCFPCLPPVVFSYSVPIEAGALCSIFLGSAFPCVFCGVRLEPLQVMICDLASQFNVAISVAARCVDNSVVVAGDQEPFFATCSLLFDFRDLLPNFPAYI